jgi:hypothetical protein
VDLGQGSAVTRARDPIPLSVSGGRASFLQVRRSQRGRSGRLPSPVRAGENLVLTCTFHHKLVHEYGWSLAREPDNEVRWHRPNGTRYRAGPTPRSDLSEPQLELAGVG